MTPIQQHEQELRAMMERAGLVVEYTLGQMHGYGGDRAVRLYRWPATDFIQCSHRHSSDASLACGAEHHDPRIALRHCLEMAGLIEDRPPLTSDELDTWLRTSHGPPLGDTSVSTWLVRGRRLERFGDEWCYRGTMVPARDIGVMLWADKRWPVSK